MAEKNPEIVAAQSIIESKLTKTEAIEIMIDDLTRELRRAHTNAESELRKLKTVSIRDVVDMLGNIELSYSDSSYGDGPHFTLNSTYTKISEQTLLRNPKFAERARQIKELTKEASSLQNQLHKLTNDKTSTKVALLKSILEQTTEGRELLVQLETIRRTATRRFGISINPRTLAGKL